MNGMSRENWSFGVQIVSAIGILVIAVATFINSSNKEFRDEIRAELTGIADGNAIRIRLHTFRNARHEHAPWPRRRLPARIGKRMRSE